MTAITLRIASSNTSNKPDLEFQSVKSEINNMEISIREALRERSQSARMKAGREAEIIAHCHNALWQQWYEWLRRSKQRNLEKVSKETSPEETEERGQTQGYQSSMRA